MISESLRKLVNASCDAWDDVGDAFAHGSIRRTREDQDATMKRAVAARAALVQAIEAEVAAEREACAKVARAAAPTVTADGEEGEIWIAHHIADKIAARSRP